MSGAGAKCSDTSRAAGTTSRRPEIAKGVKRLNRWTPFANLFTLKRDMNSLVNRMLGAGDSGSSRTTTWAPPVESFLAHNHLIVRVWIPGIDASHVDVKVSGNLLSVKGERKFEYPVPENQYLFTEVAYGPFECTVTLPERLKFDQVKAKYINGVLEITLPIHEGVLPKKVPIEITQSSSQPTLSSR
jgi:HSP20 family protein